MAGQTARKIVPSTQPQQANAAPRDAQGELELTLDNALSPAIQLQNMLVEQFAGIESTVLKADKYDVRVRMAWIVAISCAGWGVLGLAGTALYALLA